MTTIVANRSAMAADRRISGGLVFQTQKLFRVHGAIIGVAGDMQHCLKFIEWRKNPDTKPTMAEPEFEALELTSCGQLLWWGAELVALPIDGDTYAIGSGGPVALGAMEMGASLQKAIAIAAKWDCKTGGTAQLMRLDARLHARRDGRQVALPNALKQGE
jgi:ATP-dependent protease HslVU (ClpYQ) peptidase subunit